MVNPIIKVNVQSNENFIKETIEKLASTDVLVGIPQSKSSRPSEKINNAELLFIHTNGSPIRGIPARPVLQPAIENKTTKLFIIQYLNQAVKSLLDDNEAQFISSLNAAGMIAQNAARDWFTNPANNWPPNKPATIKAKGSDRPLIDTGEMRKAIVYVVRNAND